MRDRMFTLETSFPHFFIQRSMFDIIFGFVIRISHFESAVNSGLLTVDKKLLKIQHNRHPFSSKGGDGISDFWGCFISHIEVVDAVREADLGGKLEILEVDFESHACLYREVSFGGYNRIKVDFLLGLGIEQVASSANKVHAGIVESHGAVFKYHWELHHGCFIDQFFGSVTKTGQCSSI